MAKKVMSMPGESGSAAPKTGSNALLLLLLVLAIAAFAWSFWSYQSVKQEVAVLKDPQLASKLNEQQTAALLEKVGKLLVLPNEKNPVVAVINDVETLASTQDFYAGASNGNKLIIYQGSRKAIIFDEEKNIVVNVGPIFFNNSDGQTTEPAPATDRISIELRNGTTTAGATLPIRDRLIANYAFNVTKLGKAAKTDYSGYILVDNTNGSKSAILEALQKELGATVVKESPAGEADPKTEVLIIVGK